jgi:hypothetical protein
MTSIHPLPITSALTVLAPSVPVSFSRILVAIEGCDRSGLHPVVARAVSVASPTHSELCLITCLTQPTLPLPTSAGFMGLGFYDSYWTVRPNVDARQWEQAIEVCEQMLGDQVSGAMALGIRAASTWTTGDPGSCICAQARDWQAIVIGRRGYRGLTEMLLGSVSNYVLHHAPCAVLVVQ